MADLDSIRINNHLSSILPERTLREMMVLPLNEEDGAIIFAACVGHAPDLQNDLSFITGRKIILQTYPESEIVSAIDRLFGPKGRETTPNTNGLSEFVSIQEDESRIDASADGTIITLVNQIISDAIHMRASDIHVEPYDKMLRVRYRLDGVLHEVQKPPSEKTRPLISRLKIMADLDIAEKRRPQDGRIRVKDRERTIDIRVSTLPTDFGEKVVLRILDKSSLELDLSKLGFEESDLSKFRKTVRLPYGMILVTGPTGSGKTTTLYAALNEINRPEINITTIEDPIEYNLSGINQTHVRSEIGLTFAASLRSILRQDPNVIMVGEIRDSETAEIAIRAALTGHLVFSTLHTNDAASAITRLIDMGVEPFLVGSSLRMILAQRLLRKLCDNCKKIVSPTPDQDEELSISQNESFYGPSGCSHCNNTGYSGRTAIYEVLPIMNGMSDLIAKGALLGDLRKAAKSHGSVSLRAAAMIKARRGETSLDEITRETVA
jgi:type IV pilus assembly protein PilB